MTISPRQSDIMFNEKNVTTTSVQMEDASSQASKINQSEARTLPTSSPPEGGDDVSSTSSQNPNRNPNMSDSVAEPEGDHPVHGARNHAGDNVKGPSFTDAASEVKTLKRVEQRLKIPASANNCSLDSCAKLVSQLSRELAVLHGLAHGIGVDADCNRLREELRLSRQRACTLAQQNGTSLVPLLRRKAVLQTDNVPKVESLYRMYSGCLEYLVFLLIQVRSLVARFSLNQEASCYFIRAGISDPVDVANRTSYFATREESYFQRPGERSSADRPSSQAQDDFSRLSGDIQDMQHLLHVVNNACDMNPWEVEDEKQEVARPRTLSFRLTGRRESREEGVTFHHGATRRHRVAMVMIVVITVLIIITVAVTAFLLTAS